MSEVVFLFDHFISAGEQRRRNGEPERLGGLEVERHFEFRRLHYRQIGRLLAFQNPAAIDGRIAIGVGEVGAVTEEAAERDVVAELERWLPRGVALRLTPYDRHPRRRQTHRRDLA